MAQFPKLSNREWDVLKLLLQGKSNKLIALSLDISVRTVEFHLKNIYAKLQVGSRIELILKLGNTTGGLEIEKLGRSTVVEKRELAENRDKPNSWINWAKPFKEAVSIIGKELKMKNLKLQHIFAGTVIAFLAGLLWFSVLKYSPNLSIPLAIILMVSGLIVGTIGKQQGESLYKVLLSVILGTGLSPLIAIPFMIFIVVPIGKIVVNRGIFDLSAISTETATNLAMGILLALWVIASIMLGVILLKLFMTIKLRLTGSNPGQFEGRA